MISPTVQRDPSPELTGYAHPERLVTTGWLADHLDDPGVVVLECNEDVLLYESGHLPGAVTLDWHSDLADPLTRDYLDGVRFAELMSAKGISRQHAVVCYGDNHNWWATYALWIFSLFGHPDVRLLNGGWRKWVTEGRPLVREAPQRERTPYPVVPRFDAPIRAFRDQVMGHVSAGRPLIDVRSPAEYAGDLVAPPEYPQEGALRGGHIPGAVNEPWEVAMQADGTFKPVAELRRIYHDDMGLETVDDIVTYCRIGERSAHTWFVLAHLLGYPQVRNYDGSWMEWGNLVRAPIAHGPAPGALR